jgi:hypothetical protein
LSTTHDTAVPRWLTVPVAALLLGRGLATTRRLARAGILTAEGRTWLRVSADSVARLRGRPISPDDYEAADQTRDRERAKQRGRNRKRPHRTDREGQTP